jgi:tRNA threonylcarbamoyl adenosine modification protein YeaZ
VQDNLPPHQYGLALHTSSPQLGLALSNFADETRQQTWDLGRDLSAHLHQYLADFLPPQTWQDLAFLAVAKGPGSFTSTRIGIVTARTLAQQLEIPLFAISTLAAVARSHFFSSNRDKPDVIALEMPARRGQLYVAIYQIEDSGLTPQLPDSVMTPEAWQHKLTALGMPYQLIEVPLELGDSATNVLSLAYRQWQRGERPHWSKALPFYGQHPVET